MVLWIDIGFTSFELVMRILKSVGRGWLKFAEVFGNFQMTLILSVVYWTMLAIAVVPFKLFGDPLAYRRTDVPTWRRRKSIDDISESAKKQG